MRLIDNSHFQPDLISMTKWDNGLEIAMQKRFVQTSRLLDVFKTFFTFIISDKSSTFVAQVIREFAQNLGITLKLAAKNMLKSKGKSRIDSCPVELFF